MTLRPHPVVRLVATRRITRSHRCLARFNPHPGLRPGAISTRPVRRTKTRRFNPHPAVRPDATLDDPVPAHAHNVSILTGSYGRMHSEASRPRPVQILVSILTRPCDRVQLRVHGSLRVPGAVSILTQSHDLVRRNPINHSTHVGLFQSSPGLMTGCNQLRRPAAAVAPHVSILTESYDRVQQSLRVSFRPAGRRVRVARRKPGTPEVGCAVWRSVRQRLGAAFTRELPQVHGVAGGKRPSHHQRIASVVFGALAHDLQVPHLRLAQTIEPQALAL